MGALLKVIPVRVSGPATTVNTFALLDEASTITLIDNKISRAIGVKGPRTRLTLQGVSDREIVATNCEKVELDIQGCFGKFRVEHVIAIPDLCLPAQSVDDQITQYMKRTESVNIQPYRNARPKILLGQDNWRLIAARELREVRNSMLAISRSLLGWAVHGVTQKLGSRFRKNPRPLQQTFATVASIEDDAINEAERLDELIKRYFQIDSFGVSEIVRTNLGHKHALKILNDTSRSVGKRWETGLLWKENNVPSVDSKPTAMKRLLALERRLDREAEYAALYYKEMKRFVDNGYAVKVQGDVFRPRTWYLPHFGVRSANKPGKVRLVFDAAARTAGVSLNDQLESGPDLLQSLPGVLLRFRQFAVAFKGDIKDMYLRVQVREDDRGAQRFLWRERDRNSNPDVYEMTCLIFGATSSPCSTLYVKDANAKKFATSNPEASESIIRNCYVDDYLASRSTVREATNLIRDVIAINSKANFAMHGWASNNARALQAAPVSAHQPSSPKTQLCDRGEERVLGLSWDTQTDNLGFNVGVHKIAQELVNGARKPTKREFLKVIMSVFDPLGLLSPCTLNSKILMQDIWRSEIGWDEPLRDEEQKGWLLWVKALGKVKDCRVPRCLAPRKEQYTNAQLHVFNDASLKAYAAAAYIRLEIQDAPAHVALIMAKTRIAPVKPLSVPRLELQAALLGARSAKFVVEEFEIKFDQRFLWSDSATVIRWIRSEPRTRQVFVAHRLGEISELTLSAEWRWVPTNRNPADVATRWSNEILRASDPWFAGPDFLREVETNWPVEKALRQAERQAIDRMEMRKDYVYVASGSEVKLPLTGRLLGWRGLLAVSRRLKVTADRWRKKSGRIETVSSENHAEEYWYREMQADCFSNELAALRKQKPVNTGSKIANVRPFMDDGGVLRAEGRVKMVHGVEFENQPIILDSKHPATKLLIAEYHRRFYHASSNTVVNEMRQKYYIIGLRSALRSLTSKCLICKLRRAKPRPPMMSSLPAGRVAYRQRPFTHCGVDYFGPMHVKIGRRREKRWGVLFTCLTTRAIHVELAHSLSASSAIMALQRLAARRGTPSVVYSDNGTNFRGACRELRDELAKMNKQKQRECALKIGIKWVFNLPDAPHMGGAWERLIRSVKVALNAILRDQASSEEVLYTLLTEIEHSINSRPLTHVSVDPRDNEALTPNHFLIGASSGEIRFDKYEKEPTSHRRQWRIAQSLAEAFWKRWLQEYLPTLIARTKWLQKEKPLAIGDIVLIIDLQAPRNTWKKGKIVQVYPGSEGEVRVVNVRTSNGEFVRPAVKLIKLFSDKEVQK